MDQTRPGIRAIIFDLYGTLIHEPPFDDCFPALADAIGVELAAYLTARQRTVDDAMIGRLRTAEERAAAILEGLRRPSSDGLAGRLAEIERAHRWARVRPYPATVPTLTTLRQRGYPIGLVSDCTHLMGRSVLERFGLLSLLDQVALSYEVGHAKPAPEIYRAVTDALGVPPSACLYVGDGGSDELTGARALGMTTVRIDQEGAFARIGHPAPADHVVVRLDEILDLPALAPDRPRLPPLDVAWIRPDLAVGGRVHPANVPRLRVMGIESVVDLRREESDDPTLLAAHGIRFLSLPMTDGDPLTLEQLREGSAWIAAERAAGRRVLVHCQHGVGRSVMLVAAVLLNEGMPLAAALAHIRSRRPRMAFSEGQLRAIQEYAAQRVARAAPASANLPG